MAVKSIIHNRIQEERQKADFTQEELALKVGVTRQTIISIEKGYYTPSLSLAFGFCKIFKKNVEALFWE
jgi:putative transcriptional regulator